MTTPQPTPETTPGAAPRTGTADSPAADHAAPGRLARLLAAYAADLHRGLGPTHHVVSPLGAWIVVALAAPAAVGADDRAALARVLGCDPDDAVAMARLLLDGDGGRGDLRLAVGAWIADWARRTANPAEYDVWQRALPRAASRGPIPTQAELDAWASEHTDGMIPTFPVEVTEDAGLLLASAVLTKVAWAQPFDRVPATLLGGPWAERVSWVLRSHRSHDVAPVALGERRYAVHRARSEGGTEVLSVLADDPAEDAVEVLAAAHALARGEGRSVPLADLPRGEGPVWTVEETGWFSPAPPHDLTDAVLPAWEAESRVDLTALPAGVPEAVAGLAGLLPALADGKATAVQRCVARYTRTGFEAAAVTALMMRAAGAMPSAGATVLHATARFARPYAVVAVLDSPAGRVPAFSGWVAEPAEAVEED